MGFRLALLTATLALACGAASTPAPGPALGTPLPSVATVDVAHRPASLAEVTRGHAALVALWATWCPTCEKELAALDRLQGEVGSRALVVGVAVGEPYDKVVSYLRPRGLRYHQLIDEEFALADALGTKRVPTTLVIGKDGTVRYSGGSLDRDALAAFRHALAE
jgi:thiol-disulfide isomerase/thioredoxin